MFASFTIVKERFMKGEYSEQALCSKKENNYSFESKYYNKTLIKNAIEVISAIRQ